MRQVFYTVMAGILLFSGCSKPGIDGIAGTQATMFREHGLDVDWDHSGSDRIAFSAKGSDGYYDVHTANPDGSQDSCITCNLQPLTQKHIAAMAWHPSGEWLVVAVEKLSHPGSSFDALPGLGSYTDLWLINRTATKYYKILEPPVDADHGVIIPKFSHDGKKLTWTDRKKAANILVPRQTAGYWTIKVADFAFDWAGTPLISNIKTIEPESDIFIEGYGFSPDDKKIIFCSNIGEVSFFDENIYTINLSDNKLQRFMDTDYNEHAFYTPDGKYIVWMTNKQASRGTDWWMMNSDGSNQHRITYFNESSNPQYAGHEVTCGLGSFSTDGKTFVGGRQVSLITQEGEIVKVTLR